MKTSLKYREVIADSRRIVIKIGSRVLCQKSGKPNMKALRRLTDEIAAIQNSGREVVLVSSGAVGTGMEALNMKTRPEKVSDLQMAASVGQCHLISRYENLFADLGCRIGQVLLTHEDFKHKIRLTNVKRTLENLIRNKVIPIINENDVVADEELKAVASLGDNDYLASLVTKLIRADLLIMLSTVDGVKETDATGKTKRVRYIETINRKIFALVSDSTSPLSKGGMGSKLKAAQSVAKAGCITVIADGRKAGVLPRIIDGKDVGTVILASGT